MEKADYLPYISRYLHSPVLDMSGGDSYIRNSLRAPEGWLAPFRANSIRTLIGFEWSNEAEQMVKATWDVVQPGGCFIFWTITEAVLKVIRSKIGSYQVMVSDPIWVIKKHLGNPGVIRKFSKADLRPKACIFRHGALGDMLMVTPLIDHLRESGYHITLHCSKRGESVFKGDPRIDDLAAHEPGVFPTNDEEYRAYRKGLASQFDKFIDLHESVEGELLRIEGKKEFLDSWEKRHAECNRSYIDNQFVRAGFPEIKGRRPSIWLSDAEKNWAAQEIQSVRRHTGKSFIVLWNLMGSSFHKMYPWKYDVWNLISHNKADIGIITVSDEFGANLQDYGHENISPRAGKYTFRQTLAMHSVVDGVVTPETNSLISGLAFPAPVIALLSHSSADQYPWREQDIPLFPKLKDCPCYPCHQLHHSRVSCPSGVYEKSATLCMDSITPVDVYESLMKILRRRSNDNDIVRPQGACSLLP